MSEIDFSEVEAPSAPETPAAPEAPTKTFATLDHVMPETDDIDEDYRGKPIKEVLRVARQHKEEVKQAYNVRSDINNYKSRAEMAEAMLRMVREQAPARQEQDPQVVLQQLAADPARVMSAVARQNMAPLEKQMEELRFESYQGRAEMAREKARQRAGVDEETWDKFTRGMAGLINAAAADPATPKSWADAWDVYEPAVTPKVRVPTTGQAPVGQARSSAPKQNSGPRLSQRQENNLSELAGIFDIKKGTKAWDNLVKEIQSDPSAMGATFNE